jgi:hypothetical protein
MNEDDDGRQLPPPAHRLLRFAPATAATSVIGLTRRCAGDALEFVGDIAGDRVGRRERRCGPGWDGRRHQPAGTGAAGTPRLGELPPPRNWSTIASVLK